MRLKCEKCEATFEADTFVGYCPACVAAFRERRGRVHAAQRPAPNVMADGKFADAKECPQSVIDPVSGNQVCGLCGSSELYAGYGLGTGYGMGVYNFCLGCNTFLDFGEDSGE